MSMMRAVTGTEMPAISSSGYSNTVLTDPYDPRQTAVENSFGDPQAFSKKFIRDVQQQATGSTIMAATKPKMRYMQIFIADPDERLPIDDRLLFMGEPKMTDATNEELFFEIDIKGILAKHNDIRVATRDKTIKDRTEHLEAARVRDLQMVVVDIASFG